MLGLLITSADPGHWLLLVFQNVILNNQPNVFTVLHIIIDNLIKINSVLFFTNYGHVFMA